jgi:hypothetical protein
LNVAEVLQGIDPDIALLTEVEDCYVLRQLLNETTVEMENNLHTYLKLRTNSHTGHHPGFLTKIDPMEDL